MSVLRIKKLTKSFQPDFYKPRQTVLHDVSFEILPGQFMGFIGPNGAGKTTTLKCILQFVFPDSGDVNLFQSSDFLEARKKLGFVPERPYFQEFLTGEEFLNLHWSLSQSKSKHRYQRIVEVLEMVKLTHAKDHKIKTYSKGMMQRIGIAQALLAEPELLILDEPMSGLDPDGRILIKDILKTLKTKNIAVLMSSHLLEDIEELCDQLTIIHKGKILFSGALANFKNNFPTLESAYKELKAQIGLDHNA